MKAKLDYWELRRVPWKEKVASTNKAGQGIYGSLRKLRGRHKARERAW